MICDRADRSKTPIEMAFAKLKALIRRAASRTDEELWKAAGVCDSFPKGECLNLFTAAGYTPDRTP
jgi:hypothetical protein